MWPAQGKTGLRAPRHGRRAGGDKLAVALSGPERLAGFGLAVEQKPLLGCKFVPFHTVSLEGFSCFQMK